MGSTADMSPVTLPMGGRKFKLARLTSADRDELVDWERRRQINITHKLAAELSSEDRTEVLVHTARRLTLLTFDSPEMLQQLLSRDGVSKVVWMSIRGEHPDVTEDQVREWLNDPKTIQLCTVALLGKQGVEPLKAKKGKGVE